MALEKLNMANTLELTQVLTAQNLLEYNSNRDFIAGRFGPGGTMEGLFTPSYDETNLKITLTKTLADYVILG